MSAWRSLAEIRLRKRALAIRSAAFCDSALRALVFASWTQQVAAQVSRRGRQELATSRVAGSRRQAALTCLHRSAVTRREARARTMKAEVHSRSKCRVASLQAWLAWAGRRRRDRLWDQASKDMRSKQRKSKAVLQWLQSTQSQKQHSELLQRALKRWQSRVSEKIFSKWTATVARQIRNRQVLASAEVRRNVALCGSAMDHWTLGARQQRKAGQSLGAALRSALHGHSARALLSWKVHRLLQRRRCQELQQCSLAWQGLACRLRTARLRADGPLRLAALSQVCAFAFNAWAWCLAASRAERLRVTKLQLLLAQGFLRPALQLWRTQLLASRVLRIFLDEALPTCLSAWKRWRHRKVEGRCKVSASALALARHRAVRRWHARCDADMRLKKLRIQAVLATSNWCMLRGIQAWRRGHALLAEERRWLAKRASLRQWKKWLKRRRALKTAFIGQLHAAAAHDRKRLARHVLRWWSWTTAWNAANLEASARLVEESRKHRERRQRQRRRSMGPIEEELQLLEAGLQSWSAYAQSFRQVLQQTNRQVARQHGALLLISLDHWVEATLQPRRAENLRRRRHVRFNMTNAPSPKMDEGRRSSSLPSARRRSSSLTAPSEQGKTGRRLSAGALGQWAQSAPQWQAATAKAAVLDLAPQELQLQESEEVQVVFPDDASVASEELSPGSLTFTTPLLRQAPRESAPPAPAKLQEPKTVEAPQALKITNGPGTGGTSTPSAFETPVRQSPAGSPKGETVELRRASESAAGGFTTTLHQPQAATYAPLALPLPPLPTANKAVPLHLRREEPMAALPAPPKIGADITDSRRASAPASTVGKSAHSDILRFFKMRE